MPRSRLLAIAFTILFVSLGALVFIQQRGLMVLNSRVQDLEKERADDHIHVNQLKSTWQKEILALKDQVAREHNGTSRGLKSFVRFRRAEFRAAFAADRIANRRAILTLCPPGAGANRTESEQETCQRCPLPTAPNAGPSPHRSRCGLRWTMAVPLPASSSAWETFRRAVCGSIRQRARPPKIKDVIKVLDQENRLCELVDGTLVEKPMGYTTCRRSLPRLSSCWVRSSAATS
jgi:hypothetical protein